jgi:hypothetical protein
VFVTLVDVWGFITSYLPMLEILGEKKAHLTEKERKLQERLRSLFVDFLFRPRVQPVETKEWMPRLTGLKEFLSLSNPSLSLQKKSFTLGNRSRRITGFTHVPRRQNHSTRKNSFLYPKLKNSQKISTKKKKYHSII